MPPSLSTSQQLTSTDLVRLQTEMDLAFQIQFCLLPKIIPSIPGLDLSGAFQPASCVSGDFYDLITCPDQSLTFFIGDVSGKGVPAALLMPLTLSILRAEIESQPEINPEAVLQNVHAKLLGDLVEASMFVTAFLGHYNAVTRQLVYTNAGHSPIIYCPIRGKERLLKADGTALGIQHGVFPKNHQLILSQGDLLVAATDGLHEARNHRGEHFGLARMLYLVYRLNNRSAAEISRKLLQAVRYYRTTEPQQDDQTVIVMRCTA